jgi:hypothetical protein
MKFPVPERSVGTGNQMYCSSRSGKKGFMDPAGLRSKTGFRAELRRKGAKDLYQLNQPINYSTNSQFPIPNSKFPNTDIHPRKSAAKYPIYWLL